MSLSISLRLSSGLCLERIPFWPFTMNGLMTRLANYQCLAAACRHPLDPERFLAPSWLVLQLPIDVLQRQPSSATFTNDSQNRVGVSHLAYLNVLVVGPPVSLRHVDGSPVLGLLRRLRRRGTRVPQAIPRSVGAERIERDVGVPLIPLNGVVLHRPARRREPIAKVGRSAPGALRSRRCSSGCAVPPLGIGIQAV